MCMGGRGPIYQSVSQPVVLPPAPTIAHAAATYQSSPQTAKSTQISYKKRGRRALTIPLTTVNVPGS